MSTVEEEIYAEFPNPHSGDGGGDVMSRVARKFRARSCGVG